MKNTDLEEIYDKIASPEELLNFLEKYIEYGYLGKNNKIYLLGCDNYDRDFKDEYILQRRNDVLKTRVGVCWDVVELERDWFLKQKYEIKTIYEMVALNYDNPYPTHTYLIYKNKNNDKWNWFEYSDFKCRGIHEFNSVSDAMKEQLIKYRKFLDEYNITEDEKKCIEVVSYDTPRTNIGVSEFIDFVMNKNIKDDFHCKQ